MSVTGGERRFTVLVLLTGCLLLLPTLTFRMGVDQGSFAWIGAELLKGHWPYLGTWESDFPGMMLLQAGEILLFGKSLVMFRVFDLLVQLVTVSLIYRSVARLESRAGGLLAAALFCLIYQGYGPWNTAQREGFAVPLVLAGYWLWLTRERRSPERTALAIGLGLGLAALFKPTLLALAAFYLPLLPRWNRSSLKLLVLATAACAAPALAVVAGYAARGGLRELYQATIAYQAIYTARLRGDQTLSAYWLANVARLGLQAKLVALAYLPFLCFGAWRRERTMCYLGYLGSVLGVVVQGTFAGYHYLPGLALGSLLIGTALAETFALVGRGWRRLLTPGWDVALAVLLILAALPFYLRADSWRNLASRQFLRPPQAREFRIGTVFDFTESYQLAEYLRAHTAIREPVLVWGYEPLVYYLAGRSAASRFGISHPLVMRAPGHALTPMQQQWRDEFMRDVSQRKPRYVAVVQQDNWWWAPDQRTSLSLLDDFPQWKRFLQDRYRMETTIGRFLVYRSLDPRDPQ